jgi:hypothetical protein
LGVSTPGSCRPQFQHRHAPLVAGLLSLHDDDAASPRSRGIEFQVGDAVGFVGGAADRTALHRAAERLGDPGVGADLVQRLQGHGVL